MEVVDYQPCKVLLEISISTCWKKYFGRSAIFTRRGIVTVVIIKEVRLYIFGSVAAAGRV